MDDVTNYIKYVFDEIGSKNNIMYVHYTYKESIDNYKGIIDMQLQDDYYVYRYVSKGRRKSFRVKFYDIETTMKAIVIDINVKEDFEKVIYRKSFVDPDLKLSTRLYLFSKTSLN